jgi:plastocyanin
MRRGLPHIAVLVALLALAGCGGKNKVGDKSLLNFKDQAGQRLGQRTTTTADASSGTIANAKAAVGATPTTQSAGPSQAAQQQAKQQAQQQAQQAATVDVAILSDTSGSASQFDPSAVRIYRGGIIKWTNKDSVARSVQSDDAHSFASPTIPPGGSWTFQMNTAGQFPYHDGTRPYAVATVEVLNR